MRHSSEYEHSDLYELLQQMEIGGPTRGGFVSSIAHGFQRDFSDFISSRLEWDKSYSASLPGLKVFILRGDLEIPFHGPAECVVLQNEKTAAHILLVGERMKRSLQYRCGIQSFETSEGTVIEEVKELFSLWEKGIEPLKLKHANDRYDLADAIRDLFTEADFEPLHDTFVSRVPRLPAQRPFKRTTPNGPTQS